MLHHRYRENVIGEDAIGGNECGRAFRGTHYPRHGAGTETGRDPESVAPGQSGQHVDPRGRNDLDRRADHGGVQQPRRVRPEREAEQPEVASHSSTIAAPGQSASQAPKLPCSSAVAIILLQFAVDLPGELLALFLVKLHRLLVDQLVELAVTIFRVVAVRVADVVFVEILVGVVETAANEALSKNEVATDQSRQPV